MSAEMNSVGSANRGPALGPAPAAGRAGGPARPRRRAGPARPIGWPARSSPSSRTGPRPSPRSARWSSPMRGSSATCAAGRSGRSPPTCACTGTPRTRTARSSAWSAASPWRARTPASCARPRSPPAWCSTRRSVRAAPRGGSGPAPGNSPGTRRPRPPAAAIRSSAAGRPAGRGRGIPAEVVAQANAERASRHLARVAAEVARRHGYPDLGAFVLARTADGASLAAISREAGLHKDWLSRHLADVAPAAAAAVPRAAPGPAGRAVAACAAPARIP